MRTKAASHGGCAHTKAVSLSFPFPRRASGTTTSSQGMHDAAQHLLCRLFSSLMTASTPTEANQGCVALLRQRAVASAAPRPRATRSHRRPMSATLTQLCTTLDRVPSCQVRPEPPGDCTCLSSTRSTTRESNANHGNYTRGGIFATAPTIESTLRHPQGHFFPALHLQTELLPESETHIL